MCKYLQSDLVEDVSAHYRKVGLDAFKGPFQYKLIFSSRYFIIKILLFIFFPDMAQLKVYLHNLQNQNKIIQNKQCKAYIPCLSLIGLRDQKVSEAR